MVACRHCLYTQHEQLAREQAQGRKLHGVDCSRVPRTVIIRLRLVAEICQFRRCVADPQPAGDERRGVADVEVVEKGWVWGRGGWLEKCVCEPHLM